MKENSLEKTGRAAKEKLRIPVRGTNRKFYLTPPRPEKNRPDYYVRFEVPRALREQSGQRLPAVIFQSTGTNVLAAAKEIARDKIEKVLAGKWEEVEKTKLALECATIGDIGERYRPANRSAEPAHVLPGPARTDRARKCQAASRRRGAHRKRAPEMDPAPPGPRGRPEFTGPRTGGDYDQFHDGPGPQRARRKSNAPLPGFEITRPDGMARGAPAESGCRRFLPAAAAIVH
jgi:hypothetical protein